MRINKKLVSTRDNKYENKPYTKMKNGKEYVMLDSKDMVMTLLIWIVLVCLPIAIIGMFVLVDKNQVRNNQNLSSMCSQIAGKQPHYVSRNGPGDNNIAFCNIYVSGSQNEKQLPL
jgi:hypothetical protein